MKDVISKIILGILVGYLIVSQIIVIPFMYEYIQEHTLLESIIVGPFICEFKGILFPFFI